MNIKELENLITDLRKLRENLKNQKNKLKEQKDSKDKHFLEGYCCGASCQVKEQICFLKKLIKDLKGE